MDIYRQRIDKEKKFINLMNTNVDMHAIPFSTPILLDCRRRIEEGRSEI